MKKVIEITDKVTRKVAENALKKDANRATCFAIFQPKIPQNYSQYKNRKK